MQDPIVLIAKFKFFTCSGRNLVKIYCSVLLFCSQLVQCCVQFCSVSRIFCKLVLEARLKLYFIYRREDLIEGMLVILHKKKIQQFQQEEADSLSLEILN